MGEIIPTPNKERNIIGKSHAFTSSKADDMKYVEIQNLKQSKINLQRLIDMEH